MAARRSKTRRHAPRSVPIFFSHIPFIRHYLTAAARQQDKELFIQAINASSPKEALDAWERHGGKLGLDPFEDRGTDAGQLRPGIYAAITGDDRPDAVLWPGQEKAASAAEEATAAQSKGDDGREAALRSKQEPPARSLFDDEEHRRVRVTRGRGPLNFAAMFGRMAVLHKLIAVGEDPRKKTWAVTRC